MSATALIGKYRLVERIGHGAMGEVFRAHDQVLDRHVALKIMQAGDEERRMRFRREAQSAARLAHPNIVTVHDFGEDSGRFFMAMELLEGRDLKQIIGTSSIPDLDGKLHVMEQVCDAVAFAHSMNVVHRDLKPANIFVMPSGQVKIVDFGLALLGHSDMTGTGTILGTPNYMSPEQIRGQRADARADIFSLGAVFFELISGRKAFDADSLHGVMYKVLQYDPEPLRVLFPAVPASVSDLVRKALSKDPAHRFPNLGEMRGTIRAVRSRGALPTNVGLTEVMREFKSDTLVGDRRDLSLGSGTIVVGAGARITFNNEAGGDVTVDAASGKTILETSLENGLPHAHECGGNARCSTCRVLVLGGAENLSPRDSAEIKLARRLGFSDDIRLACQTTVRGPVKVRRLIRDSEDIRLTKTNENTGLGNETPLAVLYASIRETPTLLRRALPYDVVHILNRYYAQIGEPVLANGGHIDQTSGGALLAFFGIDGRDDAKGRCTNAIRAALRMQKRMETLNAYLSEHFGQTFTLDVGLHYGRMIVGLIGHPDRQLLTALGEPASIATAVAAVNQYHGSQILATEELVNIVEGEVSFGQVSHEALGGREREYALYEILDFAKPDTHYLVQSSFEQVAARKEEAALLFYNHLFQIAPHVRPMFANVDMQVQGAMLMNMIAAAVKGLDRLDDLKIALVQLGERHRGYGVRIEHFAAVEECLLHTIATIMGRDFNTDVKLAWTRIYNFIAETMIEAMFAA